METYKIVRFYQRGGQYTIREGLTLEEVQDHCNNPETSWKTCTSSGGRAETIKHGSWFDGYYQEGD